MIAWTTAKLGGGPDAFDELEAGRIATASPTVPAATIARIHQPLRPEWRRLKYWRVRAPSAISATRISQACS